MKYGRDRYLSKKAWLLALVLAVSGCSDAQLYDASGRPSQTSDTAPDAAKASSANSAPTEDGSAPAAPSAAPTTGAAQAAAAPAAPSPMPPTDDETTKAAPPQMITGAFLVDCGPAAGTTYGCMFRDAATKAKASFTFLSKPVLTVGYSDKTTAVVPALIAPAASPWQVLFQPSLPRLELLKSVSLAVQTSLGAGTFAAASVTYVQPAPGSSTPMPTTPPTFAAADSIFFVTSQAYVPGPTASATNLNFNGVAAADALCQAIAGSGASQVPASRKWMAYLSLEAIGNTAEIAAKERVTPFKTAGNLVDATNGLIITVANYNAYKGFSRSISVDASGKAVATDAKIWTGTDSGNNPIAGSTCSNWTSSSGVGEYGVVSTGGDWTYADTGACSQPQHLYCVGAVVP